MNSQDGEAVRAGLRAAVEASGLSQAGFARALGTSPSRLSTYLSGGTVPSASWYLRAVRVGDALGRAREGSWLTPIVAADEVRRALAAGDRMWGLRLILQCRDHLRAVFERLDGARAVSAAWEAVPGSVREREWDGLFAAVIGHEFEVRGLSAPDWTTSTADGSWLLASPFFTDGEVRAATPSWLAERGIFVAARDLVTA